MNSLSIVETENTHTLSDWARCSEAFRHHSHHPGFEVQVSLVTAF